MTITSRSTSPSFARRCTHPASSTKPVPAGKHCGVKSSHSSYPNAVDGAFAGRADFGTIIKSFEESEQPGRYGPPTIAGADRQVIFGRFDRDEICTSHVERNNLNIRTFM